MRMKLYVAIIVSIGLLLVVVLYLLFLGINFEREIVAKEMEFDSMILREKKAAKEGFNEKYASEMASYAKAYKNLENEKKKTRSIEKEIQENNSANVR